MYFYRCKKLMRHLGQKVSMPNSVRADVRHKILAEIRQTSGWQHAVFYTEPRLSWAEKLWFIRAWQSVGAAAVLVVFFTTVVAARASLPGDTLYPVKITMEKAQLSLAFSETKEAELEMSFASSRLREINQIIAKETTKSTATNISQAMARFNNNLGSVQKKLDSALAKVNGQSAKSLAVAVSKTDSDRSLNKLQDRINDIERKIDEIAALGATPPTANQTLKEAKAVLGQTASTSEEGLSIIKKTGKNQEEKIKDVENILGNKSENNARFKDVLTQVEETKAMVEATKQAVDTILDK